MATGTAPGTAPPPGVEPETSQAEPAATQAELAATQAEPAATQAEPEASRRILLGAIDAFAERGFHATTTRDIAARAGLSPAALYVHYPSKAALLAQISLQGHRMALELTARAAGDIGDGDGDAVTALRTLVVDFVSWHAENHRIARVVQYELLALPDDARDEVRTLRRRIEHLVENLIRAGIEQGSMDVAQPRRVARAILSLGIDVARWYDPTGRDTPTDLGALYADLAARMVGAREPSVHPAVGDPGRHRPE